MEKLCGIYCIENLVNGKKYVGQSTNVKERLRHHKSELNSKSHFNTHLQNAWDLHGKDSFNFYVIMECEADDLDYYESYYITLWNLQNRDCGYNNESGGNCKKTVGEDTKAILSEQHKKENLSAETLKQMSESAKMRCTDEWRAWRSRIMSGRKANEDTKKKMSESHTGQTRSQDFKNIQRTHAMGEKVTCVETNTTYLCAKDAAKELGHPNGSGISSCCKGDRKTAYGYHWKFADDIQNQNISSDNIL